MIFPFNCQKCEKTLWLIQFNTEEKYHKIQCANCGTIKILEEIFGNKRRTSNGRPRVKRTRTTEQPEGRPDTGTDGEHQGTDGTSDEPEAGQEAEVISKEEKFV